MNSPTPGARWVGGCSQQPPCSRLYPLGCPETAFLEKERNTLSIEVYELWKMNKIFVGHCLKDKKHYGIQSSIVYKFLT